MRPGRGHARSGLLLAGALLLSACSGIAGGAGPVTGERAGFSPGAALIGLSPEELAADLDRMKASGGRWVRVDVDWSQIEPEPGRYAFDAVDRVLDQARARGLRVVGLLAYTPTWARPAGTSDKTPPADAAPFARFAAVAAQRWGGRVDAWEVWNEPNLRDFWAPRPDPAAYADLLRSAAPALREADPGTPVLSGGLAPAVTGEGDIDPVEFLTAVYDAGAAEATDGVAVHPYSYPALPTDGTTADWNTFVRLPRLHAVMTERDDPDAQVWITEFGAPTGTGEDAVDPDRQARIVAAGLERARELSWVELILIYSLRDAGDDPADREQNFGVLGPDGSPKPAWDVLRREFTAPWGE